MRQKTVGDVAREFLASMLERGIRKAAAAINETVEQRATMPVLPVDNLRTQVRITMVGEEEGSDQAIKQALDDMLAAPQFNGTGTYLLLDNNFVGERLILLQFSITLECSAAQAEADVAAVLSSMVDHVSVLATHFAVTGVA